MGEPILTWVHSSDLIGDIFGSRNKQSGDVLHGAGAGRGRRAGCCIVYESKSTRINFNEPVTNAKRDAREGP